MLQQIQSKPIYIGTARFTTETYNENMRWKKKKEWDGACYGFDKKISTNIPYDHCIFVIEMNNTINAAVPKINHYINGADSLRELRNEDETEAWGYLQAIGFLNAKGKRQLSQAEKIEDFNWKEITE